jgi:hypothetical protein
VLPSGVVGSLAQKALPLALMSNSSLYIKLKLAPALVVFTSPNDVATGLSYTVSDVYYNAKITTLPNDVNNKLMQTIASSGVVNLPAVSYKTEKKGLSAQSTLFNDKFGYQFSSVKNFLFWFQNQGTSNGTTLSSRSVSTRSKANMKSFYLTINGVQYPSQAIEGYNNMYANLLRAFDSLTDTNSGGVINYSNYTNDLITTASDVFSADALNQKRFIGGLDLDKFNLSSEVIMSGLKTHGMTVNLFINFNAPTTDATVLYSGVMYDVLYTISDGRMVENH